MKKQLVEQRVIELLEHRFPCDDEVIAELLPLYLSGDISDDGKQEVEEHLATCKHCQALRLFYENKDELLQTVPKNNLRQKVRAAVAGVSFHMFAIAALMYSFLFHYVTRLETLVVAVLCLAIGIPIGVSLSSAHENTQVPEQIIVVNPAKTNETSAVMILPSKDEIRPAESGVAKKEVKKPKPNRVKEDEWTVAVITDPSKFQVIYDDQIFNEAKRVYTNKTLINSKGGLQTVSCTDKRLETLSDNMQFASTGDSNTCSEQDKLFHLIKDYLIKNGREKQSDNSTTMASQSNMPTVVFVQLPNNTF